MMRFYLIANFIYIRRAGVMGKRHAAGKKSNNIGPLSILFNTCSQLIFAVAMMIFFLAPAWSIAGPAPVQMVAEGSDGNSSDGSNPSGGSETALPDLFSGAMSYHIPIEVPAGRNGMEPTVALRYWSNGGGNGWLGVGWDMELGSIQRAVKYGVDYTSDNYQFKTNDFISDIVQLSNTNNPLNNPQYLATIESKFSRILTGC
jgi:hypothetical protein